MKNTHFAEETNVSLPDGFRFMPDNILHTKYVSLFVAEAILFIFLGYYLWYKAMNHIKLTRFHKENMAIQTKHEVFFYLSIANICRGISIIYIFLCLNRTDNDIVSFINYLCHIIPTMIFISVFFHYIKFIIEKYYEIKIGKKDIFFSPSLNFFHLTILITLIVITFACLISQNFKSYMYICLGITSILFFILAWFYLYFGINLANYYSESHNKETETKEKSFIRNKMLFVSIALGILFLIRGVLSFLTCVDVFKDIFPNFMNANLWDQLVFFSSELLCSCIIGYTRQNDSNRGKIENHNRHGLINYNNEIAGNLINEEFNNLHEPLMYNVNQKI